MQKNNEIVDHKEHNKSDNRKDFLRKGTQSNNMMNTSLRADNTSQFTGISFSKQNNNWVAEIHVNKSKISLGSFQNKEDAIIARKIAEEKYFGKWSFKNSTGNYNNEKDK